MQLGAGGEDAEKPKMTSLLKGMSAESLDLETAIKLASLPRTIGQDEEGVDIVAYNGRYGPYIKRGADTRSLSATDDLLTLGMNRAKELLAEEKKGRGRTTIEPLKVFENVEELEGGKITLNKGRYGPYVTDGDVNASLPGDIEDPLTLTVNHALELLATARERKGAKKSRKKAAKKPAAKKKAAKKVAKKPAAKKKTVKKAASKKTAPKKADKSEA